MYRARRGIEKSIYSESLWLSFLGSTGRKNTVCLRKETVSGWGTHLMRRSRVRGSTRHADRSIKTSVSVPRSAHWPWGTWPNVKGMSMGFLAKWGQKIWVKIAFIVVHRCASHNLFFFLQFIVLWMLWLPQTRWLMNSATASKVHPGPTFRGGLNVWTAGVGGVWWWWRGV